LAVVKTEPRRRPLRCKLAVLGTAVLAVAFGALAQGMPEAVAENNGAGLTPAMGWSSWSFLRHGPTARNVEAQARAMVASGLTQVGYSYVNLDDFWYICPGSQGPQVDRYGRWVPNPATFPPGPHGQSGIQVVGAYVHRLGLKFGLYVTPGISKQAVVKNTPILATNGRPSGYTAAEIGERSKSEYNYNCGGMVGINYKAPGAQDFIDSWADEFASWGIDYLKLDGVGSFDIPDVKAWSQALRQTGRPIHLELSNSLDINFATTWAKYSNGWRTGRDIECYSCETGGSSYPLTDYASVETRFAQVAAWRPYGRPGAFNDYDSIEVGNGSNDGLTLPERETQLSLWALASSPFILGTNLTHLNPADLALLKNRAVIAVDQDAIDAHEVMTTSITQIFAKSEKNGDVIVGLFNTSTRPENLSVSAASLGLGRVRDYAVDNLWLHQAVSSPGLIKADVPPHGVALFRVSTAR
jgi:Alpha galactosidase A/Alpha galactosidase C-terminal beta sandwich domain